EGVLSFSRFAGLEAAVPDRATLVRRFDAVSGIARLVQRHEELFGIAIETALAGLVRRDFDEGVVAAFLARRELQLSEGAGKSARARRVPASLHSYLGEKFIGDPEDVDRS